MLSKTVIKWPKQVTAPLVEQLMKAEKDLNKALVVFDAATAEYANGFRHDNTTFGLIISRLLSANQFQSAENMLIRMKEEKCEIKEDVFLCIYRAYGRAHKPLDAIRVFKNMNEFDCQPSERSYITIFSILVDENQLKTALRFYRFMRERGVPPSVTSLNILIKALCKNGENIDAAFKIFREMPQRGCPPDSYTYGTLINGLCKLGKIKEARELLLEMDASGCSPSVVTYSSLIHGLCQCDGIAEAMELFEEMKGKNVKPNVFTYSSLMDGLCKCGRTSEAMNLLESMVRSHQIPNMITYSTLINGLCKEKRIEEAVEIIDRMKLQGLKPEAGLYSKVISGFCDIQRFREAANFLEEMVIGGVSPNRITWSLHVRIHNIVIQGLCGNGDPNRAFQLYLSTRTRGISVESKTFEVLIIYFCKKGDLHKVANIFHEMVIDGCIPEEEIWKVVIGGFWSRKKVQEAAESVQARLVNEYF